MATEPIVSLKNIKKSYLGNTVFDGLNLSLIPGNFYALLGKNGSGKSTLIRILAHREIATSGEGMVLGTSLDCDFAERANLLAYVSEATYMPPGQKIRDLMALHAKVYPKWDPEEAARLAEGFHLNIDKRSGELSRGQLVQMSLVLNLSYGPLLILLDEVTSVLDASARGFLMEELSARVKIGATVLLATNIVTEVQDIANALVLVGGGRIRLNTPISEISSEFLKLKRNPAQDHPIYKQDTCIEVGLSASGAPLYPDL